MNENQLIVLDWLKKYKQADKTFTTCGALNILFVHVDHQYSHGLRSQISDALNDLGDTEQCEVLIAFADWSLKQC